MLSSAAHAANLGNGPFWPRVSTMVGRGPPGSAVRFWLRKFYPAQSTGSIERSWKLAVGFDQVDAGSVSSDSWAIPADRLEHLWRSGTLLRFKMRKSCSLCSFT